MHCGLACDLPCSCLALILRPAQIEIAQPYLFGRQDWFHRIAGSKHVSKHSRQRHLARVQVTAKAEEGAEPGRLVQDALEFNKSATSPNQLSGRAPVQQEEHQTGDLLGGKYQVIKLLAKGKTGLVYKVIAASSTHLCMQHTTALQCEL